MQLSRFSWESSAAVKGFLCVRPPTFLLYVIATYDKSCKAATVSLRRDDESNIFLFFHHILHHRHLFIIRKPINV